MYRRSGIVVVSLAALWGIIQCGSPFPLATPLASPFPSNHQGKQLYGRYCALCHGENGEGYLADESPALGNQDFLTVATDEFIAANTLRGRPGTPMSAWGVDFGGALTAADGEAVVAHLRTWQNETFIDSSAVKVNGNGKRGSMVYGIHCETCHGDEGRGATAITLNNPVFQETAGDGLIRFTIERGRRKTKMEPFEGILNNREIDDVSTYVKNLPPSPSFLELVSKLEKNSPSDANPAPLLNPRNPAAKFTLLDNRFIPAQDVFTAYNAKQSFVIIDARPYSDYLISHLEGAISMPFYDVEQRLAELPKDRWIVTYCGCPHAISGQALDILRANGYEKSGVLNEGIYVWAERGYPMVGDH